MRPADRLEPRWRLADLLAGLSRVSVEQNVAVGGIAVDSRGVRHGDVFFACNGGRVHGMSFAAEALARGAVAVVFEPTPGLNVTPLGVPCLPVDHLSRHLGDIAARFCDHPSARLTMYGVTGTDGKTSVSHFVAQALGDQSCGLIGTLGYGLPDQLVQHGHTTPDALSLQQILARLYDAGSAAAAMEVSSHALDQCRVGGIEFDVAIFTNLGRDHLDYHGTVEAYGAAKRRLFERRGLRAAVINVDDAYAPELLRVLPAGCQSIGYGRTVQSGCDHHLKLDAIEAGMTGITAVVSSDLGSARVESRLLGSFNAYNLLATLGALIGGGFGFQEAVQRLSRAQPVAGRMEAFGGEGKPLVVVDYAHTPQALRTVLSSLRAHCKGRLWCVFGCGGDRDAGKRPLMGRAAEELADRVILTNDNPRSESPGSILEQIASGLSDPLAAKVIPDRASAIESAVLQAMPGDIVLIAGKGHESVQIIGTQSLPFSDRAQVRTLLSL